MARSSCSRVESNLPHYRKHLIRFLLFICIGILPTISLAQAVVTPKTGVTSEVLESRIQEVEATTVLDDANKAVLLDIYRQSQSLIEQRITYETATGEFVNARDAAPIRSAALRKQVAQMESREPPKLAESLAAENLPQLEQQLLSDKAHLSGLRAGLAELEALLETQALRSQQIRKRIDETRRRQDNISANLSVASPADQSQRLTEARLWALQLETRTLTAEVEMLNQELLSQPMRMELYNLQRDRAEIEWSRQQQQLKLIVSLVGERRRSDAETARLEAEETERRAFGKHSLVQEIAQSNTRLGEELNQQAALLEEIGADENIVADQVKRFTGSFRLARQKLEIAGLSQALGQAFLEQRNTLPRLSDFKSAEKRRQKYLIESSLRQIRNQQERVRLIDIDEYVDALLAPLSESWQFWIREEVLLLLRQRQDLLDKAIAADDSFLLALGELDFAQQQLSQVVGDYNKLLDERLLWVRTGALPSWQTLVSIGDSLDVFTSPQNWRELGLALIKPEAFPWVLLIGLALFAVLKKQSPALRAALKDSSRNVGQLRHDRFRVSIKALMLTLVLALPWPILFTALGLHFQLARGIESIDIDTHLYQVVDWSGQFVPAIGTAFLDIALYTFYFVAFRIFCESNGLAIAHFKWSLSSTRILRRETRRLMTVFLPAVFLLIAAITYDSTALASGMSRLLIFIIMMSLTWFFGEILSPARGALRGFYADNPTNLLARFRYVWLSLGLLLTFTLGILSTVGYVYTAAQLGSRLVDTLWLIVAIILIHQLVVRWVVLLERRLEFKDALDRHRAQRAAREAKEEGDGAVIDSLEEPEIDFGALSEDTKKLINTALIVVSSIGLWAIWSAVLPAFRILDDVSLWSYSTSANGAVQQVPVTIGDVIVGLLIIVFGIIVARRLPAVMEFALFARFNFTAGSRYAISKLTQYVIITIGIVMVFNVLGGSWGEIQWLIAALGVGIGFGLQEIIANFICGVILLFERPIRIGDIVTVGDTSGIVTRIQMRSTTIRNWDQQELLVPNKEFITGRLLNWTLSDPVARIVIAIGIAYGSDVGQALRLLHQAAEKHERVLVDPEPLVTLESFGDNALEIKLRCYIGSMDFRLLTLSELNQTINREFEAAGIVIAFPQRDIHLDTSQPLEVNLRRALDKREG